jgi:flagellar protein FlbD
MIVVTRLNGSTFGVNPDLVGRVEESPDTHIYMLDGSSYIVKESLAEITESGARYRAWVLRLAREEPAGHQLTVVRSTDLDGSPAPAVPLRPGK